MQGGAGEAECPECGARWATGLVWRSDAVCLLDIPTHKTGGVAHVVSEAAATWFSLRRR
ncbi:hypothetical protein GCM10009680_82490 [Streptomyces yatensis]|uniref:Uncharacterized protein n=1 Tax=Streptomyces yatensis TaxID=155177 RepID=A0ABN2JIX3_9ACTN